jgi:hypothetical protein
MYMVDNIDNYVRVLCCMNRHIFHTFSMDPAIFLHKDIPWSDQIKRAFHYSGSLVMGSDRCPQLCIE